MEQSKEQFRKALQAHFPDPDILLNKNRMAERYAAAPALQCPQTCNTACKRNATLPTSPTVAALQRNSACGACWRAAVTTTARALQTAS